MSDGRDTVWVGLDLGTSSLKAIALDGSGAAVAEAREGYDTARPGPGLAEQDPASWTGATRAALATIAARVPPQSWGGIGLSGMIPTLAMVDAAGEPLHPALTWEDCRAHAEASAIADQAGGQALYELTGQPLDGRYLLPMFAWFLVHEPEVAERAALLLSAKDYLFYWLTGQAATDPSTATGYGCYDLGRADWLPQVAALAHVSVSGGRPGLPPVTPSTATWPLDPARATALGLPAGLPVCVGAADSVLAAEALGAVTPGSVAYVWGTSTVILGAGSTPVADPQRRCLITPLAVTGWGVEMDLVSTGAAVQWLAKLLGFGADGQARVFEAAAAAEDAAVPAALPFVGVGEQGALWDNDVRGTLVGLGLSHGPGDVARAVLDGIVLESRRCLERLSDFGLPEGEVRVAWRTAEPWFCRRLADASGREVLIGDPKEASSAAGAARLAAAAAGRALPAPPARGGRFTPDPAAARLWQQRWTDHEAILTPLRRLYRWWPGGSAPEAGRS
jgi:xylulokinase